MTCTHYLRAQSCCVAASKLPDFAFVTVDNVVILITDSLRIIPMHRCRRVVVKPAGPRRSREITQWGKSPTIVIHTRRRQRRMSMCCRPQARRPPRCADSNVGGCQIHFPYRSGQDAPYPELSGRHSALARRAPCLFRQSRLRHHRVFRYQRRRTRARGRAGQHRRLGTAYAGAGQWPAGRGLGQFGSRAPAAHRRRARAGRKAARLQRGRVVDTGDGGLGSASRRHRSSVRQRCSVGETVSGQWDTG